MYPLLWFGVIGSGGRVSGCNPAYHALEVTHHFKVAQAKFVITEVESLDVVRTAAKECGIPDSHIYTIATATDCRNNSDKAHDRFQSWEALCQHGEEDWVSFNDEARAKETIAALGSTSGTTGLPKAAIHPHKHFIAQNTMIATSNGERPYRVCSLADNRVAVLLTANQVTQLVCLPMFHAFTAQVALITPLRYGHTSYYMPRFQLESFLGYVQRYKITDLAVVPPIVTALNSISPTKRVSLHSLRYILCAGAPLDGKVQSKLYGQLAPEAVVGQVWGVTELAWITSFTWKEKDESGSVGRLLPSTELKILDEDGNAITEDNVRGEAYVRSPSMFNGYLNNPEANREAFQSDHEDHNIARTPPGGKRSFDEMREYGEGIDKSLPTRESSTHKRRASDPRLKGKSPRATASSSSSSSLPSRNPGSSPPANQAGRNGVWYRTGDVVYVSRGRVFVAGRCKEIIKVRGWQVSPSELEAILLTHDQIADVAVKGVVCTTSKAAANGLHDELPRAYVVKKPSASASAGASGAPRTHEGDGKDDQNQKPLTEEDVKTFLGQKVVGYKRLDGGVKFVEKIPRNPTGKILRRLLKD